MPRHYDLNTRTRRFPLREETFSGGGPDAAAAFSVTAARLEKIHSGAVISLNTQVAKHAQRLNSEAFDQNYFATFVVYDGKPYLQVRVTYQLRSKPKLSLVR